MKGETEIINGDRWTIVDVAPAAPLAEMVAALLEDEGFLVMTRSPGGTADILTHLGTHTTGATYVLVPEQDADRALQLIADTVTDYEGEELEALLDAMTESEADLEEYEQQAPGREADDRS